MDTNILHSVGYSDSVERQAQHPLMHGFPLPLSLGEAMSNYHCGQMSTVADSADFWNAEPAMPLPGTFAYPVTENSSGIVNPAFGTTSKGCEGGFAATNRWGFNSLVPPVVGVQSYVNHNWMVPERQEGSNSKLSLSLATLQPISVPIHDQCSEMSSPGGITSYSLHNFQSEHASSSSSNLSDSQKPPQMSQLISGSRFFQAMQEILAEIACYALENFDGAGYTSTVGIDGDKQIMLQNRSSHQGDVEAKKKHLLNLLQMVDERYNQCLDEIHTVVSAFHAVTELDPNLHARFALPTISLMYKKLRERISSHILSLGTHNHNSAGQNSREEETVGLLHKQWAIQQLRKRDHQVWRPQRGLPERSVSVLRSWMFQNFLHPYPKDAEKHLLAMESGLTRSQVSNWFINARVRLWKPMIEEMDAEINRRKTAACQEDEEEEREEERNRNHMHFEGKRRFTMN